ncbi:MAG: GNAT family N-acetyltransferase, partial [Pseudopedobacter sp.]|nr:GNAT family N-acetyltransferase [Deinococcales bacterium]
QVLAVLEEAEGQGIGQLLLERATLWAQEKGLEGLSLHVFSTNVNAQTFYAKLGFQEDNIRLIKPD